MVANIEKILSTIVSEYKSWCQKNNVKDFNNEDYKYCFIADFFKLNSQERRFTVLISKKCLEVCEVILYGESFEYMKNEENSLWFYTVINMTFMENLLNWGTSIRVAWFEIDEKEYCFTHFTLNLDIESWGDFIKATREFTRMSLTPTDSVGSINTITYEMGCRIAKDIIKYSKTNDLLFKVKQILVRLQHIMFSFKINKRFVLTSDKNLKNYNNIKIYLIDNTEPLNSCISHLDPDDVFTTIPLDRFYSFEEVIDSTTLCINVLSEKDLIIASGIYSFIGSCLYNEFSIDCVEDRCIDDSYKMRLLQSKEKKTLCIEKGDYGERGRLYIDDLVYVTIENIDEVKF